jgi:carboxypeptidase Taq
LGVHESQSRLWENLVGRSRGFWSCYLPRLRRLFPQQLGSVGGEEFYRAINRATPSLIRVEADEVTYNLHIILRYEMECDLLQGKLDVADAPEAWNAKMQDTLGLRPGSDSEGILQDVHWSIGAFGYFPTYTLGNILSVQLWQAALSVYPDIPAAIASGDFAPLLGWLRHNVHCHGRRYTPAQLTLRATGSELDVDPYANYLESKFHEIYGAGPD